MNLPRIFANAIARRVAFVVVGVFAALLVQCFGEARAACVGNSCDTRGEAWSMARSATLAQSVCGGRPGHLVVQQPRDIYEGVNRLDVVGYCQQGSSAPVQGGNGGVFYWTGGNCPVGETWDEAAKSCDSCSDRPALGPENHYPGEGMGNLCSEGCSFACSGMQAGGGDGLVIDGQHFGWCTPSWEPTGQACSVGEPSGVFPPPDSDGDGTSDGNDGAPNNPGSGGGGGGGEEGGGEDGSSTCGGPGQPVCDEDGSNGGSGKGNTSGGGGTCSSPPTSTGDAILAQIAFQTWATRCALAGPANGGNGGSGGGSGPGTGDGEQPDWTKGNGPEVPVDDTDYVSEQTKFGLGLDPSMLDTENIFGSSSCPSVSFVIRGRTISSSDVPAWCQWMEWARGIIILIGAWRAMNILLGRSLL